LNEKPSCLNLKEPKEIKDSLTKVFIKPLDATHILGKKGLKFFNESKPY